MAEEQLAITEKMNLMETEPPSVPVGVVLDFAVPRA